MDSAGIGLVGVLIGGILAILSSYLTTKLSVDAQRRKNRQDYLTSRMDKLTQSIAEYEVWLAKHPGYPRELSETDPHEHARIIGEAIAICLSVGDLAEDSDLEVKHSNDEAVEKWRQLPDLTNKTKSLYRIHRLSVIANERLTRNFVVDEHSAAGGKKEIQMWGHFHERNRTALNHAAKRLAQLINDTQRENDYGER